MTALIYCSTTVPGMSYVDACTTTQRHTIPTQNRSGACGVESSFIAFLSRLPNYFLSFDLASVLWTRIESGIRPS